MKPEEAIKKHTKLIYKFARQHKTTSLDIEDLVIEGQLGLLRALKTFDKDKGVTFTTYAGHWIQFYIKRAIQDTDRLVRIPVHMYGKGYELPKQDFIEESEVLDLEGASSPESELIIKQIRGVVHDSISSLDDRSSKIIELRFGLKGNEVHTLKQTAKVLGLSTERIRTIQNEAISKLKSRINN